MGGGYEPVNKRETTQVGSGILETSRFYRSLSTPAVLLLTFLFVVPLAIILSKAFIGDDGGFSFSRITRVFTDAYTLRILRFTIYQAFISTVVSVAIGLPGAYILATYRFKGKKIIKAICTIPFVLPSILVVLGFVIFYGNNGLINTLLMKIGNLEKPPLQILYTFGAVILAHAFYNFPIALGIISSFWEQLPSRYDQTAMTLGAKRWTVFRTVTFPRLIPAILSASTLIFLFCFSSFVILLVLGGGPRFTTLEVEIYRQARMTLNVEEATALSLLSIGITLLFVALHLWAQRSMTHQEEIESTPEKRLERSPRSWWGKVAVYGYALLAFIFVLGPLAAVIQRSFLAPVSRSGNLAFSLRWYKQLFGIDNVAGSSLGLASAAILRSLFIAIITALISLIMGTLLAARLRRRPTRSNFSLELYAMLPMAVSSVVIGLGYYLISAAIGGGSAISLTLVVFAHVVIASPFVLRTILPEYRKIPFSYTQVSLTLGATVSQTFWRVELPLLRSAIATGAAFAFAISMGEINATLVLADSNTVTVPIVMYRLIGSYNFAGACALGTVLMLCCAIVFIWIESMKKEI